MSFKEKFLEKLSQITRWFIYGIPYALMAGLLDYRFHNYYYPGLNSIRPLTGAAMFDFFSVYDLYLYIGVFLTCALFLFSKQLRAQARALFLNKKTAAVWLLILVGMVVVVFDHTGVPPHIHSLRSSLHESYFVPLLTFFVVALNLTEKKTVKIFVNHLIVALSGLCLLTLFQYVTQNLPGADRDFLGRAVWPYIDPFYGMKPESANWLAYLAAPLALFASVSYKRHSTKLEKFFYAVGFIIGVSVLVASKSYTGIGAFALALSVYLWKTIPTRKAKITMLIAGLIIFVGFGISQKDSRKFQILLGNYSKENSVARRFQIYQVTWRMLSEKPIIGISAGNYQSSFRVAQKDVLEKPIPEEELPPHPHNLLLDWWSDLGICGLFSLMLLYLYTCIEYCKKMLTTALIIPASYFLIHGLFDVPFGLLETSTLFCIVWALVVRNHQQSGV